MTYQKSHVYKTVNKNFSTISQILRTPGEYLEMEKPFIVFGNKKINDFQKFWKFFHQGRNELIDLGHIDDFKNQYPEYFL